MKRVAGFIRSELVFCVALVAAVISSFFVPLDKEWLNYFDMRTLALLYCLMVVVAGFRQAGVFARLAHDLCHKTKTVRSLGAVLVALSFFSSMFITNDVALLTFVPFAVAVYGMAGEKNSLILVVVLQTVAANLGSMLLPVGNPQNLYIQSHYDLTAGQFLKTTAPVWGVSLFAVVLLCLLIPKRTVSVEAGEKPDLIRKDLAVYLVLFVVCLMTVCRILSWQVMTIIVLVLLAGYNRRLLLSADFMLLLTFVCFFVFSGNMARISSVNKILRHVLTGKEYIVTLLTSQIISNVPATLLLSGFTDNWRGVLLGADIGGLGTPIASLASLIALRLYSHSQDAKAGRFFLMFSAVNFGLLVIIGLIFAC